LSWTLAFPITILLFILISGFLDANILANSAMAIPIITFLIGVFTIIGYEISIEIKGNIADKFSNKYIDFIVDEFEQKLTNERHNFNE
jgi:surface polysaccharide O-acyltransferase-like enzyme